MAEYSLKIHKAILWVSLYFGIMLFYTFLDITIWRKIFPEYSRLVHIITIIICVFGFILLLRTTGYRIRILSNITFTGVLWAIGCAILFYGVLDNCLDPFLERIFPASEQQYQDTISRLIKSPVTSFLQICMIAPVIEEILMRGFILRGLTPIYGSKVALLVSTILFALLHFNTVQTLSAFICGSVLGLLYIKTNSIFCCMIAHSGYNLMSYAIMIYPYTGR